MEQQTDDTFHFTRESCQEIDFQGFNEQHQM